MTSFLVSASTRTVDFDHLEHSISFYLHVDDFSFSQHQLFRLHYTLHRWQDLGPEILETIPFISNSEKLLQQRSDIFELISTISNQ